MKVTENCYAPVVGIALLLAGPFVLSYPFLAAWYRAGWLGNPLSPWLLPVLATSLIVGSVGFVFLRFKTSTKVLMALLYVPMMCIALRYWSYSWCPLCAY